MNRPDNFERFARTEEVRGDLKRKSVLGALATGAGGSLDFVLRLGSTLILARLLVPEHFGLVAMVTAITRIAERFATLGLSTATVQAPEITEGQCSNLFWINVAAGGLFAGLLVVFLAILASLSRGGLPPRFRSRLVHSSGWQDSGCRYTAQTILHAIRELTNGDRFDHQVA